MQFKYLISWCLGIYVIAWFSFRVNLLTCREISALSNQFSKFSESDKYMYYVKDHVFLISKKRDTYKSPNRNPNALTISLLFFIGGGTFSIHKPPYLLKKLQIQLRYFVGIKYKYWNITSNTICNKLHEHSSPSVHKILTGLMWLCYKKQTLTWIYQWQVQVKSIFHMHLTSRIPSTFKVNDFRWNH